MLSGYGSTDAIHGLQLWSKKLAADAQQEFVFPWMEPAIFFSRGQYEKSAEYYLKIFKQLLASGKPAKIEIETLQFASAQVTKCFLALHDFEGLKTWPSVLGTLKEFYPAVDVGLDPSFLRALMSFDTGGKNS